MAGWQLLGTQPGHCKNFTGFDFGTPVFTLATKTCFLACVDHRILQITSKYPKPELLFFSIGLGLGDPV